MLFSPNVLWSSKVICKEINVITQPFYHRTISVCPVHVGNIIDMYILLSIYYLLILKKKTVIILFEMSKQYICLYIIYM